MGIAKIATILSAALMAGQAAALEPIVIKGTKFFYRNGTQFYIKGIAYQQDTAAAGGTLSTKKFIDPLVDEALCRRDVPILAAAGTNVIRTYAIDPNGNHDACMRLLQDAGIYVVSDLGEPSLSINRDTPAWNTELFGRYKGVVDNLAKYDNVIGFFAGNEVSNNRSNTPASAYVKAAVRDTKAYIKQKGYRPMGVGYAANDDPDIRVHIAQYFNCGKPEEAIDFWGYNIYSWCGQSSFRTSGYADQVEFFRNYSVPVFFAEYGCNTQGGAEGRIFQETTALYSSDMTDVISGGIVYMYHQEANDYGLVSVSGNQARTMKNYNALKTAVLAATPASTAMSSYNPTNVPQACPAISNTWAAAEVLPPVPDTTTCECMYRTLSCVAKPQLSLESYGDIFNFICGSPGRPCAGISGNTSTGVYGAFSPCNDTQKLGFVLNEYYKTQKFASSACDFAGQAQIVKPAGAGSNCQAALSSASAINSVAATATSAPGDKNAAPGMAIERVMKLGDFAVGAYLLAAMGVGAGMVML
jgi:hypothetical protein